MQRKLNLKNLCNDRLKNETFEDYKIRQKMQKQAINKYKKGDLVHVSATITEHLNEDNTKYYTKSKGKTFKGNVKKQLNTAIFV